MPDGESHGLGRMRRGIGRRQGGVGELATRPASGRSASIRGSLRKAAPVLSLPTARNGQFFAIERSGAPTPCSRGVAQPRYAICVSSARALIPSPAQRGNGCPELGSPAHTWREHRAGGRNRRRCPGFRDVAPIHTVRQLAPQVPCERANRKCETSLVVEQSKTHVSYSAQSCCGLTVTMYRGRHCVIVRLTRC